MFLRFCLFSPQRLVLFGAPARQAAGDLCFVSLIGRLVKVCAQQGRGQVLLRDEVTWVAVRVLVPLPVAEPLGVAAGVH